MENVSFVSLDITDQPARTAPVEIATIAKTDYLDLVNVCASLDLIPSVLNV